ncbi:jerky protein-like, partial [Aphis craccivora]
MNNNSSENEELNTPDNTACILLATGVNKLNKPQLISELNKRGLIDTGLVPELKTRLLKYLNEESLPTDFSAFEEHNFAPIINVGSALTFFENSEDNALVKTKWEDLEYKLRTEFEPIAQTNMFRILLGKRKQLDDEQTTSYINDAESLFKRVDPLIPQPEI